MKQISYEKVETFNKSSGLHLGNSSHHIHSNVDCNNLFNDMKKWLIKFFKFIYIIMKTELKQIDEDYFLKTHDGLQYLMLKYPLLPLDVAVTEFKKTAQKFNNNNFNNKQTI